MKRSILLLSFTLVFISAAYAQKYSTAKWHKNEYKNIDGIPHLDYLYDGNQKVFYLITNDSSTLYVNVKAVDKTTQEKIMLLGLTVWIDKEAKNKKKTGLRYPVRKNPRELAGEPGENIPPMNTQFDLNDKKARKLEHANEIELIGFSGKNSSEVISTLSNNTIKGSLNENVNGDLLYQLIIPFNQLGIEYALENLLSINIASGTAKMNKNQQPPGGRVGGGPGGGGMQGGRKPPGGMPGGKKPGMMHEGMKEKTDLSTPIKIKLKKIKLGGK